MDSGTGHQSLAPLGHYSIRNMDCNLRKGYKTSVLNTMSWRIKLTSVGESDGDEVGRIVGSLVGSLEGTTVFVGRLEGNGVGSGVVVGLSLGGSESTDVGMLDGILLWEGPSERNRVGSVLAVGLSLGDSESADVGIVDGEVDADGSIVYRMTHKMYISIRSYKKAIFGKTKMFNSLVQNLEPCFEMV